MHNREALVQLLSSNYSDYSWYT